MVLKFLVYFMNLRAKLDIFFRIPKYFRNFALVFRNNAPKIIMTLHIFNPEHDIALASGLSNFTAPHAGRQLRHDLGFLPALWAKEDDVIMVDDTEQAEREWRKIRHRISTLQVHGGLLTVNPRFTYSKPHVCLRQTTAVEPWGWNSALKAQLLRYGIDESIMPTDAQLQTIRELSHRRIAATLLPELRMEGTVGEAFECQEPEQVEALLAQYGQVVMKAPWSSSGRGLRFLSVERTPFQMQAGWFRNVVATQGSVMVEPYYNKVKDIGMEFYANEQGQIFYLGLSLFHTTNGAYTGNILATETTKRNMISNYIPVDLLKYVQEKICNELSDIFNGRYQGPFGVDMMICNGSLLHPCVEINLRRTMGHVALALSPADDDIRCVMRIDYSESTYKLKINKL